MPELPRGTVTFLFTDIEGSTRLLSGLGDRYADALAEHRQVLRDAFERHGGVEVDTQGDAFFVAFARASDAIDAAEQVQRALASGPIRLRIGIHTGEPQLTEGGYVGMDVHRAARICGAAHGGQALLTQATRELLGTEIPLRDLGEHRLKDLTEAQRLYQLLVEGLPSDFPPPRTLESRPQNLPTQPTLLVGRELELADALALLRREDVRLLTFTGPGGSGKTRLALQVAAEVVEEFPQGVFFVALAPLRDPALVVPTVAQALGVREQPGETLAATLAAHLRERELLLLLDNFEQVVEAAAVLAELLASAPRLKLAVTSRAPLRLSGEREFPVPPLADADALTLFVERAQAVKPSFALDGNRPLVAEICRRLDHLPLAVELAAARIKLLPPKTLLERLDKRFELLRGGPRDLPERQQTLRATIDWSYNLLSGEEQRLLRRLSVFVGGQTLEAAEAVCNAKGDLDLLEGLASLVDKNLLRQEEETEEPRFTMLETVHEYARERLAESGEEREARSRHLEFHVSLAERAGPELIGPDQLAWRDRLTAELDNIRAALRWAIDEGEVEAGLRLASALWEFWSFASLREGERWLEELLACGDVALTLRPRALFALGWVRINLGMLAAASTLLCEVVAVAKQVHDDVSAARALNLLGWTMIAEGRNDEAVIFYRENLEMARRSGDRWAVAGMLSNMGCALMELGMFAEARAAMRESRELWQEAGDVSSLLQTLANMAELTMVEGDYDAARTGLLEVLPDCERVGDLRVSSELRANLGLVELYRGELDAAQSHYAEALRLVGLAGGGRAVGASLWGLAGVAAAERDRDRAARLWGAAQTLHARAGSVPWAAECPVEERFIAPLKAEDEAAWTAIESEGRAMSAEDAVTCALARPTEGPPAR